MTYTVDQVVEQYVKLRDKKAELAAKHKEELSPINEAMEKMEGWLLAKMQSDGVDSFKTQSGTAFKAHTSSVTMGDSVAFKEFVMHPFISNLIQYLFSSGVELQPHDVEHIKNLIQDAPLWSLTDIRAAKKGVQEYLEEKQQPVPGVTVNPILNVNIRRA